jgi:uridylate kinase
MGNFKKQIILSLGGSLVVPNGGIDTAFLTSFNEFIRKHVTNGTRFFIIVGGGATCRHYQDAAHTVDPSVTHEDLDWLGIHTTRTNAHLVRTIFREIARPRVFDRYDIKEKLGDYPIVIGAGWKPGWSTDYDAVYLCKHYGARLVINLSNIEKVYTKDPNKFPDAKPIDTILWKEYRNIVGDKWTPGLSAPFDPMAAKLADELHIKVIILDGRKLENLENAISDKPFVGTTIS